MAVIGLIQLDILWEDVTGNIDRVREHLTNTRPGELDLLVLPELWSCGFTMNQEAHKTFDQGHAFMKEIAQTCGCAVLGGLPHKVEGGQENRCYLVHGEEEHHYTKIKVFKFAGEHHKYQAGEEKHRWPVAGFQLSPFICYDLRFPELPRSMVPESNLISYVACWPKIRSHHWRSLLMARAIENLSYVIGANRVGKDPNGLEYSGDSMVISPAGEVVLDAGDRPGLHLAEIDPNHVAEVRERWPFLQDR